MITHSDLMGQTNILKVARKIPNLFEKHNFTETNITIAKKCSRKHLTVLTNEHFSTIKTSIVRLHGVVNKANCLCL